MRNFYHTGKHEKGLKTKIHSILSSGYFLHYITSAFFSVIIHTNSLFPETKQISSAENSEIEGDASNVKEGTNNFEWKGFIRESIQGSQSSLHPSHRPAKYPTASRSTLGLGADYENDKLKIDLDLRGDYIFSNYTDSPLFDVLWNRRIRNRFFYLERNERTDSYITSVYAHRMYASYNNDTVKLTAGRQAISWGQGRFLNPLDLVTPVGPFVIDIEDIPGADALNATYYFTSFNMIEGVIAPYRRFDDPEIKKITYRDTNALIRFKGTAGKLDYFVTGGYHFHSWVWGFDMNYTAFGASFRIAYLGRGESKLSDYPYYAEKIPPVISHQAVVGASYTFFKKLQTNFEVFGNSASYSKDPALIENIREETAVSSGFLPPSENDATFFRVSGRIITKNPVLIEASLGYALTDFLNITVFAIEDPVGKSSMFGPSVSYSLSDEAILALGAWTFMLPSDRDAAEFGEAEPMAFMYIRWHF